MAPLIALIVLFTAFFVAGLLGVDFFAGWLTPLRFALAGMFLLTASAHWGKRRPDLVRMVPPAFGNAGTWVTITGVLELLGAAGLLIPSTARYAAIGLTLLLFAMFPANLYAARTKGTLDGRPVMTAGPRTVLQMLFVTCTMAVAIGLK